MSSDSQWNNNWLGALVTPVDLNKNVWKSPSISTGIDTPIVKETSKLEDENYISENDLKEQIDAHINMNPATPASDLDPTNNVWASVPTHADVGLDTDTKEVHQGLGIAPIQEISQYKDGDKQVNMSDKEAESIIAEKSESVSDRVSEVVENKDLETIDDKEPETIDGKELETVDDKGPECIDITAIKQGTIGKSEDHIESVDDSTETLKNPLSDGKESGSENDDFGDFEELHEAKTSRNTKVADIFYDNPSSILDKVYASLVITESTVESPNISTLLDYGKHTRKYYNSFSRPTRQFLFPKKTESVDSKVVIRWNKSHTEKELLRVLALWDDDEFGNVLHTDSWKSLARLVDKSVGTKTDGLRKSSDNYAAMFGWSTSIDDGSKDVEKIKSPRIQTMREKLTKRAAAVADQLVLERQKKEQAEREADFERQRKINIANAEKAAINRSPKKNTKNDIKEDKRETKDGKPATLFSPFNNIFGFQKHGNSNVKLSSKTARQIKKSNVSSKDFFKKNNESEESVSSDSDGFGDFVFETNDLDPSEEDSDGGDIAKYGTIGENSDVSFGLWEEEHIEEKKKKQIKPKKEEHTKQKMEKQIKQGKEKRLEPENEKNDDVKNNEDIQEQDKSVSRSSSMKHSKTSVDKKPTDTTQLSLKSWFGFGSSRASSKTSLDILKPPGNAKQESPKVDKLDKKKPLQNTSVTTVIDNHDSSSQQISPISNALHINTPPVKPQSIASNNNTNRKTSITRRNANTSQLLVDTTSGQMSSGMHPLASNLTGSFIPLTPKSAKFSPLTPKSAKFAPSTPNQNKTETIEDAATNKKTDDDDDDDDDFGDFELAVESSKIDDSPLNATSLGRSNSVGSANNVSVMNNHNELLINSKLNEIKNKSKDNVSDKPLQKANSLRSRPASMVYKTTQPLYQNANEKRFARTPSPSSTHFASNSMSRTSSINTTHIPMDSPMARANTGASAGNSINTFPVLSTTMKPLIPSRNNSIASGSTNMGDSSTQNSGQEKFKNDMSDDDFGRFETFSTNNINSSVSLQNTLPRLHNATPNHLQVGLHNNVNGAAGNTGLHFSKEPNPIFKAEIDDDDEWGDFEDIVTDKQNTLNIKNHTTDKKRAPLHITPQQPQSLRGLASNPQGVEAERIQRLLNSVPNVDFMFEGL